MVSCSWSLCSIEKNLLRTSEGGRALRVKPATCSDLKPAGVAGWSRPPTRACVMRQELYAEVTEMSRKLERAFAVGGPGDLIELMFGGDALLTVSPTLSSGEEPRKSPRQTRELE